MVFDLGIILLVLIWVALAACIFLSIRENAFDLLSIVAIVMAILASFLYINKLKIDDSIQVIEETYLNDQNPDKNGVSEYELRDRLNSDLGREIIEEAIDNDEISFKDGRVYIGDQELLDVLGLD